MTKILSAALFVVVFVCSALLAIVQYSDAQEPTSCPAGTELAADGVSCLSPAVDDNVTTTASCIQGVLSDDGTMCIVPRLDDPAPAAPGTGAPVTTAPVPAFTG